MKTDNTDNRFVPHWSPAGARMYLPEQRCFHAGTTREVDGKVYCYGYTIALTDEPLEMCSKCFCHINRAR